VQENKLLYSPKLGQHRHEEVNVNLWLTIGMGFIFLVFNPFLALFAVTFCSAFFQFPRLGFVLIASLAFTLFFYFREYDMRWGDSSDDIPSYIEMFYSDEYISFSDIFTRFIESPGNNEPLWHMAAWGLINLVSANKDLFIFLHYYAVFSLLFYSLTAVAGRHYMLVILAYFFLTPISIDSVFHIWRQQLAFSMFLLGISWYLYKGKKRGLVMIYLSLLMHLVSIFFILIFVIYQILLKNKLIEKKKSLFIWAFAVSGIFILGFTQAINLFSSFNLDKIATYFEGSGSSNIRLFIVMIIYLFSFFMSHFFFKNDNLNKLIIFINVIVTTMTIAFPWADSIFNRLSYFTVPLVGIYFVRWFLFNMKKEWLLFATFFIFLTGVARMVPLITTKYASAQFLAMGHPLDPMMGVFKMIFFFE
jgi:hypothetical protein